MDRTPTTIACYAVCYAALLLLTKLAGGDNPLALLPVTTTASAVAWVAVASWRGWWRVARYDRDAWVAAVGSVGIMFSSVVAYAQKGASLLLPLVVMQGGMLLVARAIDRLKHRPVTREAGRVLLLVAAGVGVALWPKVAEATGLVIPPPNARGVGLTLLACSAVYLAGYAWKLSALDGRKGDESFLAGEMTLTMVLAVPASLLLALLGADSSQVLAHARDPRAWGAGAAGQGAGLFGVMIYLSAGPHSVCVPLTRAGKMIAGLAATGAFVALTASTWSAAWKALPSAWEVTGAAVLVPALWIGVRRPA